MEFVTPFLNWIESLGVACPIFNHMLRSFHTQKVTVRPLNQRWREERVDKKMERPPYHRRHRQRRPGRLPPQNRWQRRNRRNHHPRHDQHVPDQARSMHLVAAPRPGGIEYVW